MMKVITEFTLYSSDKLGEEIRWGKYLPLGIRRESVLSHSYSSSLLAIIVLNILEDTPPDFEYDPYKLLSCVILHDLGEIDCGDTLYKDKSDSNDRCEYSAFKKLISQLPASLQDKLVAQYSLQFDEKMKKSLEIQLLKDGIGNQWLYEFIERTGYIMFAIDAYEQNDKALPLLLQVMRNQLTRVESLLTKIPQMRLIITNEFINWSKELLQDYSNEHLER